ncbi:amino acid ABC transporter [Methylosinus sp. C49]|jgi:polar amino acid transport system substrate-binding protein|uniref:transporter substrate-binding domain-containing protein n=1 Tax=Methylosinus sp. C49 TaxID=2699395 RepID=UPI001366FD52|nr:transporter substrate-binding domain-containing protein [Methylosinus sp. C49]BBU60874.1 amino acid ABC transporter [Methylosinus sp. C49]
MIRRLATAAAAIALLLCPAAAEPRHLRIASEGARPPFNYLDANNQLAGFEIDLTREICRRIEADCVFVTQEWESLVLGLENRQYDLVASAMEISEERQRRIDFSKPYAHTPSALIAQRQSALASADPKALQGARIGVVADGPQQAYAEDKLKESEVQRYATLEAAMLDLAEGRVDVVAEDKLAAMDFLRERKEGRCCRIIADLPQDAAYFGGGFGYGLRKGATELKSAIDAALDAIVADGSYRAIRSKYFDFDIR